MGIGGLLRKLHQCASIKTVSINADGPDVRHPEEFLGLHAAMHCGLLLHTVRTLWLAVMRSGSFAGEVLRRDVFYVAWNAFTSMMVFTNIYDF